MNIDQAILAQMLTNAAALLKEHADELSEIDSRFGDGDHGITILKIAKMIETKVSQWENEAMDAFLVDLGMAIMEVKGGSAGPLYGTMVSGLGVRIGTATLIDGEGAKSMLAGCLEEMQDITTAKVGDKTMMDSLIPAAEAAQTVLGDARAVWLAAAEAGEAGAEASRQFVSKYGRAKSYKEQTIGTPDAGAVSMALFLRGMANGI